MLASSGKVRVTGRAVNVAGTIDVSRARAGKIAIKAGKATAITGKLLATSSGGVGGNITVTGKTLKLSGANVDASGTTGGGDIDIGGGRQGQGTLQHADRTSIDAATTIKADATQSGNGGNVVVWSDLLTTFAGTISARGGVNGGNGGFVETSGRERLSVLPSAYVNTLAPVGVAGNWLLDPKNIVIQTSGGSTGAIASDPYGTNPTGTDIIAPSAITGAASNVTLQASNDITINDAVSMTNSVLLTLNAGRSVALNANVTSRGGFTATINDAGAAAAQRDPGQAAFTMAANTVIATTSAAGGTSGAISITTGTLAADSSGAASVAANIGDITLAAITTTGLGGANASGGGGNITVTNSQGNILSASTGGVAIAANAVVAASGTAAGKAGGTILLTATNGSIGSSVTSLGNISANGGNGLGTNQAGGAGGVVTLTAGASIWSGAITSALGVRTGTGTVGTIGAQSLQATNGSITTTADTLSAGSLTFAANASAGIVTIQSLTAATTMGIANSGSAMNLTAANLALMTAKTLQFGTAANTGGVTIGAVALPNSVGNVVATSGSLDAAGFGAVTVKGAVTGANGNLTLNATAADVYLQSGIMTIGTLTATAATAVISSSGYSYNNASGVVSLSSTGVDSNDTSIALGNGFTSAGTVKLSGPGQIYQQAAAWKITNLLVTGGTLIDLTGGNNQNQIANLAANTTGRIKLLDNANLNIASIGGVDGVRAGQFNLSFASTNKSVTQSASANITANEFDVISGGTGTFIVNATLTNAGNKIGTFAAAVNSGTISLSGSNGLVIGSVGDDTGAGANGVTAGTLVLSNSGAVTQTQRITATGGTNLLLLGTGNYTLTNTSNLIQTLAANTTGRINLYDNRALSIGTVSGTAGVTADALNLQAGNFTTSQTQAITVNSLTLRNSTGNTAVTYALTNANNSIANFAAAVGTAGVISLTSTSATSIGSVLYDGTNALNGVTTGSLTLTGSGAVTVGSNGITANSAITVISGSNLTIASTAKVTAGLNSNAVLSATGNFINNRGSDAISVSGTGRWLVYSNAPSNDTFNGLDSSNTAIWNTTYPTAITATGNRYVFAYQPTLTITTTDTTKTYGDNAATDVASRYTISGYQPGVAGAFVGDDAASVFSGTISVTSAGSAATAGVGSSPYTITAAGPLTARNGYAFSFVNTGRLTVNRAALAIAAADQNKTYGTVAALGTTAFTQNGLLNNDSISGVTLTSSGSVAGAGVNGGTPYAIMASNAQGSGLSNYTITYSDGGLTVNQRPITITADAQSRLYGDANPALSYVIGGSGLVNSDTLTGGLTTAATTATSVGSYAITQGNLAASSNYALSYVGNSLAVTARPISVTADPQSRVYGDANPSLSYAVGGSGLVNNDTLTGGLATAAATTSNVGSYAIGQGSLAASTNYTLTYNGANLAVTQRSLVVTADAQSRVYGDGNPALTYAVGGGGLVNGDTLSGSLATGATTASNVGNYAITQGTLLASNNYSSSYTGSSLLVTPRPIIITADAQNRSFGDINPTLTYRVGGRGLVNNDGLSGSLSTSATTSSSAGSYEITRGTLMATVNYGLTYIGNTLTITAALQPAVTPSQPSDPAPSSGAAFLTAFPPTRPSLIASDLGSSVVRDVFGNVVDLTRPLTELSEDKGSGTLLTITDPRFGGTLVCLGGLGSCVTVNPR